MVKTYEELLAAQTELAHFNANHDPRNGQFAKKTGGSSLDPRSKTILKRAGIAGLALGAASGAATVLNASSAQNALDAMGFGDKLVKSQIAKKGLAKAGKVAVTGALAVIGGHMVSDYMKLNRAQLNTIESKNKQA